MTIMMCWLVWYTAVGVCAPGRMEGLLFWRAARGGWICGLWKNGERVWGCVFMVCGAGGYTSVAGAAFCPEGYGAWESPGDDACPGGVAARLGCPLFISCAV